MSSPPAPTGIPLMRAPMFAEHAQCTEPGGVRREDGISRPHQHAQHQIQGVCDAGGKNDLVCGRKNVEIREAALNESPQRFETTGPSAIEPPPLAPERAQRRADFNAIEPFRGKHA